MTPQPQNSKEKTLEREDLNLSLFSKEELIGYLIKYRKLQQEEARLRDGWEEMANKAELKGIKIGQEKAIKDEISFLNNTDIECLTPKGVLRFEQRRIELKSQQKGEQK